MRKAIEKIADHFGPTSQALKAIEELGELSRAIARDLAYHRFITDGTLEEVADCLILIEQLIYIKSKTNPDIERKLKESIEMKLDRTLERIKIDYYDC